MKISIKHLPKHVVFAALYNAIVDRISAVSHEQAEQILKTYKSNVIGPGPLFFDYIDALTFFETGKIGDWGLCMKVDLSYNIIDSTRYDENHGKGKCEAIINELKKNKITEIRALLAPGISTNLDQLSGNTRQLVDALQELEIDVQNYERLFETNRKLQETTAEMNRLKEESTRPSWFNFLRGQQPAPAVTSQVSSTTRMDASSGQRP